MGSEQNIVQIDPGRTLCWEECETIRIGFDRGYVRVSALSPAAQRVLHSLISGIPDAEFVALEHRTGRDASSIRELLDALRPVLVRRRTRANRTAAASYRHPSAIRTQMHDDGREFAGLRDALEAHWLCKFERGPAPPELVIQVLRFLEPLERTRRWLGEGIPHLVVRLTDDTIRIGPLVAAHGNPCHACEALHLIDADAALPALAVQLHGKTPGSETAGNGQLVGAVAAQFVRAWKHGAGWVHTSQVALPVALRQVSGLATMHTVTPHPECGCALQTAATAESLPLEQSETVVEPPAQYSQTLTRVANPELV